MEALSQASLGERLRGLAQKAAIFAATSLNPFGCGYVNTDGTRLEVHDHGHYGLLGYLEGDEENFVVCTPGVERYDPDKHGLVTEWLYEGNPIPVIGVAHSHGGKNSSGPYEFGESLPK